MFVRSEQGKLYVIHNGTSMLGGHDAAAQHIPLQRRAQQSSSVVFIIVQ